MDRARPGIVIHRAVRSPQDSGAAQAGTILTRGVRRVCYGSATREKPAWRRTPSYCRRVWPARRRLTWMLRFDPCLASPSQIPMISGSCPSAMSGVALNFVGSERDAILALPGAEPPGCEPDQPTSKSCVVMPEPMLSESDEFRSWMIRNVPGLTARSGRKRA